MDRMEEGEDERGEDRIEGGKEERKHGEGDTENISK